VLARDEALDAIFSYIGFGEYYYVAGVCRNWRGRYLTLCHTAADTRRDMTHKLYTFIGNATVTELRLQLALDNGLTIDKLDMTNYLLARSIVSGSLEPIAVIKLARLYGMQWGDPRTCCAASGSKYELLKWLQKCGCPMDVLWIVEVAGETDDLDHMKQIRAITGPWPKEELNKSLWYAGTEDELAIAQFALEQGAEWPESFWKIDNALGSYCWSLRCVQWALANDSTWLDWRCQDLAPRFYECDTDGPVHSDETCYSGCSRQRAVQLFTWAHENGCPCTCNEAAAPAVAAAAVV
jgi:hypothetical protein